MKHYFNYNKHGSYSKVNDAFVFLFKFRHHKVFIQFKNSISNISRLSINLITNKICGKTCSEKCYISM